MESEHVTDELLSRHFDGDLPGAEAGELEAHLAACRVCAARGRALARLSNLVHAAAQDSAANLDFAGMFEQIERGIEAERNSAEQATKAPSVAQVGTGARVLPLRKRSPVLSALTAASAGLAIAAAVLLMVYEPSSTGRRRAEPADSESSQGATATAERPSSAHSEVVEVDFGASTGTVFEIAMADGSSTPVVWINDDE